MNNKRKRKQYGLGSWLGDNASDILKTGAGTALTASGVGAPIGVGLLASGASGIAANNLVEDPNAKAAIQTAGNISGTVAGSGLLSFAMGGNTQLSEINNGGTHEQNPNGGVPMGQTASVEQGETKWEDYIFSDRITVPGAKHTFADESKKIQKKYPKERENDVPTQKAKKKEMERLMATQEAIRTEMGLNGSPQMANGGRIKAAYGLDLMDEVDNSGIRVQDMDPSLYTAGTNYVNRDNIDMDALFNDAERESAQAVANQKALNLEAQNKYNTPTTGIPTITTGFSSLGKPTASVETPGVVTPTDTSVSTIANPETNYVTGDTGVGNTTQKGVSGFDKYDAITMGAQLLPAMYNIGQGLRKQKPVNLGRINPRTVDYSASRKASEDSFNQQANILNESIRENATSSGQALSNRVAFANRAAQDRSLQLGQINEREYNTNQQIRGNADQVNLQIRANEEMIDAQNKGISQTSVGMGLAQVGQAAGTINRDRNLRNTENEMIDMLGDGTDFALVYDPKLGRRKRVHISTLTNKNTQV